MFNYVLFYRLERAFSFLSQYASFLLTFKKHLRYDKPEIGMTKILKIAKETKNLFKKEKKNFLLEDRFFFLF